MGVRTFWGPLPGAARELILLRHASAVNRAATDFDRALTDEGRRQAEGIGRQLLRKQLIPDRVVSSPARRAWETANLACRELGVAVSSIVPEPAIYDADTAHLLQVVKQRGGEAQRLMLVGHNPGLTDLGAFLAKPTAKDWGLARGAAVQFAVDGPWNDIHRARATIVAHFEP